MGTQPIIWLFRDAPSRNSPRNSYADVPGEAPEDGFASIFEKAGFQLLHVPVLRYENVSDWEPVPRVDAVVLTSPRAAAALHACDDRNRLFPPNARRIPWFSMGPATCSAIEKLGIRGVNVVSGSATKLAEEIIRQGIERIAFFAGEPHRTELTQIVEHAGISVEKRIVYRSLKNLTIDMLDLDTPNWAVFFSPRGVEVVSGAPGPDWRTVQIAAIGRTTASAVRKRNWNLAAVAEQPDAESLIAAIQSAQCTQSVGSQPIVELTSEL